MYILITPATALPVSVEELKQNIGIFHTEKDSVLAIYLQSAVDYAERFTGRQLMPAVWELQIDTFYEYLKISKAPFISLVSIKYYDSENVLQTLVSGTDFDDCSSNPALIHFKTDFVLYDRPDALQIRFNAGYANAAAVPAMIKAAIILMAGKMYDNPIDSVENLPKASTNLLRQYRIWQQNQ
jgi:uncharacterized phiE125 gp8 family phage protein